jgi:hypothetical protein
MLVSNGLISLSESPYFTLADVCEFGSDWLAMDEISYVVIIFQDGF